MSNKLKEIRKSRGLTQSALAQKINSSTPQIVKLERGERQLTQNWLLRLSKALDCTMAEILDEVTISKDVNWTDLYSLIRGTTFGVLETCDKHELELTNREKADTVLAAIDMELTKRGIDVGDVKLDNSVFNQASSAGENVVILEKRRR